MTSHWPPLYPLLLSASNMALGNLIEGARILHCILFGLNTFLFYCLVSDRFQENDLAALGGTLLFALTPGIFSIHYMAWSEVPFISLTLLFLIFLRAWQISSATTVLIAAAIATSAALLTRYSGVALAGAAACILLFSPGTIKSRFTKSIGFGLLAILPLTAYLLARSLILDNPASPRNFVVHLIEAERAMAVLQVAYAWFKPAMSPAWITALFLLFTTITVLLSIIFGRSSTRKDPVGLLLFIGVFYIVFLFISISFFDFYTPVDNRTMSPLFVFLVASMAFSIRAVGERLPALGKATVSIVLALALLNLPSILSTTSNASRAGSGYLSQSFRAQDLLPYIASNELPSIYSNSKETITFYFDRDSQALPATFNPSENKVNEAAQEAYAKIFESVRKGQATVIYFNRFSWRAYYPPLSMFEVDEQLPILYKGTSGVVFGIQESLEIAHPVQ
ncbi:MAG: glycosyltransferase family 39 protein [Halioglobus sp.]